MTTPAGHSFSMTEKMHRVLEDAPTAPRAFSATEAGGVRVITSGQLAALGAGARTTQARDDVPSRLVSGDATLWGPDAEAEAGIRLGWLTSPSSSRELLPRIAELRDRFRSAGLDHVVLAGMGGSSLAPEVITRTAGVRLTILDTTDPHQLRATLGDRLDRTVVVVSSKSGGTIETDSHRRAYEQAFRDAGINPAERIVVVTDPGSPLDKAATEAGYEVFHADPDVGGRYSALTAFGLVPTGLAGADVGTLLDEAAALQPALADSTDNPGLDLGAVMGGAATAGRHQLLLAEADSGLRGFGDWAEQLIAESTGKEGKGLLPVVVEGPHAVDFTEGGDAAHRVLLGTNETGLDATTVSGPLGAQFLLWEYATAVAGRILGINPFDQPNVQESKDNVSAVLAEAGDGPLPEEPPAFVDGAVEVHADARTLGPASSVADALHRILTLLGPNGYLAVMAYLDRQGEADAARLRAELVRPLRGLAEGGTVTFGWGPRFLHSTGQYHKGGSPDGAFLIITGAVDTDIAVPGKPYTFGRLQLAQALGDSRALGKRGRPVVRLHLRDRKVGLAQLLNAAEGLQA